MTVIRFMKGWLSSFCLFSTIHAILKKQTLRASLPSQHKSTGDEGYLCYRNTSSISHFTKGLRIGDFSRFLAERLTRSGYYVFVIY